MMVALAITGLKKGPILGPHPKIGVFHGVPPTNAQNTKSREITVNILGLWLYVFNMPKSIIPQNDQNVVILPIRDPFLTLFDPKSPHFMTPSRTGPICAHVKT